MPKKTVDDWEGEGWTRLDLAVGISHVPYDPTTQDLKMSGQRFHPDGHRFKGGERPKIVATEDETGCQLTTSAPVTVLYKLEPNEDEDDEAEGQGKGHGKGKPEEDEAVATIQPADDTEPT